MSGASTRRGPDDRADAPHRSPSSRSHDGSHVIRPDLQSAAAHLGASPLTRFAPSPTGYLHLGHVVNAIYVWGLAHALGGSVLLRVEDHDRVRCRPEYESALRDDLQWLGILDLPTTAPGWHRQSTRDALYRDALERLGRLYHVYACDCSRRQVGGPRYSGRCRDRQVPRGPGTGLRVAIAPGWESFDDLRCGPQRQEPSEDCGDLLVRDRDGHWTYHFAVAVDDLLQGVSLVIRGEDLLSSTGRQLRLTSMLIAAGVAPPRRLLYLHHPLIHDARGHKLSKSTGATGVRELRRQGLSPAEVIGRAVVAAGLRARPDPLAATDLGQLFESGQDQAVQSHPKTSRRSAPSVSQ